MNLGWKDLIGTIGTGIVAMIGYLNYKGLNITLISNNRWASAIMLVIGLVTCALSGRVDNGLTGTYMSIMGAMGFITMLLGILGIITGNRSVVLAMVLAIILLWIITTLKHIIVK